MEVLISIFSYILASTFSYWQQAVSFLFAFRFCTTWCVAGEMVATLATDIRPNFVTVIRQCRSKHPDNKAYENWLGHYENPFVPLRMEFFRYFTNISQKFLKEFQAGKPMVAFLSSALKSRWGSCVE